jgi:hypothetical protein
MSSPHLYPSDKNVIYFALLNDRLIFSINTFLIKVYRSLW